MKEGSSSIASIGIIPSGSRSRSTGPSPVASYAMWTSPDFAYRGPDSTAMLQDANDAQMAGRGRFLFVTLDGGGNVPPALGLCRHLRAAGHSVRVIAPRTLRKRIEGAGCEFQPFPADLEWDPAKGRAIEDQEDAWDAIVCGVLLAETVLAEVEREPADVLVVDCLLRNALSAAERTGLPTVGLVHVRYGFWQGDFDFDEDDWEWGLACANEARGRLGLEPITRGDPAVWPSVRLLDRCTRALVVLPREFEDPDVLPAANARYVGPVFEEDDWAVPWDLPWPVDRPDPLVVVSFSTTYMHQEEAVARVMAALEGLPVRALVTLGPELEPAEVPAPSWVEVRRYVPHAAVLPHASLVVTHAGMGTVMAALAYGVPMLCIPLDRDQPKNAERVRALGAGNAIASDAPVEVVRAAIVEALGSEELRAGAKRMAEIVASYGRGARAIDELEALLAESRRGDLNP